MGYAKNMNGMLEMHYTEGSASNKSLHGHSGYQLIFAVKGSVEMSIDEKIYKCTAPAAFLINVFEQHKVIDCSDDYARYLFVAKSEFLEGLIPDYSFLNMLKFRPKSFNHMAVLDGDSKIRDLRSRVEGIFKEMYQVYNSDEKYAFVYIKHLLGQLLILLGSIYLEDTETSSENLYVIQAKNYIEQNYSKIDSIEEVASNVNLSSGYLAHIFKDSTGYSLKSYLLNCRLLKAKELLLSSQTPVNEICEIIGFSDISNFIRFFRQKYKLPPNKYRKANRITDIH